MRLRREIDGIPPGAYLILHIEDASAMLCRLHAPENASVFELLASLHEDELGELSLCVTNIYNLSVFEETSLQLGLESSEERV